MPWDRPPTSTETTLKRGGGHTLNVYSLQKGLNAGLVLDGVFGAGTEREVREYQASHGLGADGVAGPMTQRRLIEGIAQGALADHGLPSGLLNGIISGESGFYLTAVNWSVSGGCDCGAVQRRVYEPYTADACKRAFDTRYQVRLLAGRLRELRDIYAVRSGVTTPKVLAYIPAAQRAWRLAVLNHNYPYAADAYSRYPEHRSSYWTTPQSWVTQHGFEFADGAPVRTPFDWCQMYALGAPAHNHEGIAVRGTRW